MIGTIRKHSKGLWLVIATLTIISFIGWNLNPASRGGGVGGRNGLGTIYGHKVTQQDYINARNEFYLFYWFHNNGEWPDRNPNIKPQEVDEQIYLRLMLEQKAEALGVHVSEDATALVAGQMLKSLGRNGQPVPFQTFLKQVLTPEGMTASDFERFARNDLAIQQLAQTLGLAGALVTPQEAAAAYQRERQEMSAQIVFFSASNFLSQIVAPPQAVAQFYTNYLAQYRLPDRVQVSFVEFNLTNYLAQSKAEWAKTNLEEVVDLNYRQLGPDAFPDAKTPEAEKDKIREQLIRQRALLDARVKANEFATAVFNLTPARPENLATVAKQMGLTVNRPAPFGSQYGPLEFIAPTEFIKAAFALTPEDPISSPKHGPTAEYVIALDRQLPSEIPPLDQIRDQVTQNYKLQLATVLAQRAGTNFVPALASKLAAGQSFASACVSAGFHPETLPPFSLTTPELPALAGRVNLTLLKQAIFATPPGHVSDFVETENGGFIVYVQSRLPVDAAVMTADLPQYTAGLRRARESEAFNLWVQSEANRQLRNTPVFRQPGAAGTR